MAHQLEIEHWPAADPAVAQRTLVRDYIDNTLAGLLHALALPPEEGKPSVTLRIRSNTTGYIINPQNGALEELRPVISHRTYSWPGNSYFEAWRFSVILKILSIIEEAIRMGHLISKRSVFEIDSRISEKLKHGQLILEPTSRDIYYVDPVYFRSQRNVDTIVDDLAYTIGVERAALNVEAAGKGLVTGSFLLRRESQVVIDAQSPTQDNLITRLYQDDEIEISAARWIIIVEKEAVFHRLARNGYHTDALTGKGILVTGKGYPDLFTRAFVRRLVDVAWCEYRRNLPVYALVDGDPDGMAIMSTYKYGSMAHSHKNAGLVVPNLQYLGIRISDAAMSANVSSMVTLPLTARDRQKILSMLQNSPVWAFGGPEPEWRAELQRMLMLNMKAEIEALYRRAGGLERWIDRKMFRQE